jgi:iron(II)-dependent oxidoreductase
VGRTLPTEAQWEKAARSDDGRIHILGNSPPTCDVAVLVYNGFGCGTGATWPVGSKPAGASPYGALDMVGNVAEWVSDWHATDYYAQSPAQDPTGPANGTKHATRGSHLAAGKASSQRLSTRRPLAADTMLYQIGFRCALDAG